MTDEYLHDPGSLPPTESALEGEAVRDSAREHAIVAGFPMLYARIYAQGYVEGKQQLACSLPNAEGFTTGYGCALDSFVQAKPSGEHILSESAMQVKEANLRVQFAMKWPEQPERVEAVVNGYGFANEKLRSSPPSAQASAQAYAYGYARAFVEHLPGMAPSESPGEILRKKAEALCG